MKLKALFAVSAAMLAVSAYGAHADSINFGQFGNLLDITGNVITGTTTDGVGITVTGPGAGFQILEEQNGWNGNFPLGTPVLYDNGVPGAVSIDFASPITSITDLAIESNLFGSFMATLTAYDGAAVVGTQSVTSTSANDPGTQVAFNFSSGAITSIVLSSTNDDAGLGLGGAGGTQSYMGAPEPSIWALTLIGVGGVGLMLRRAKKTASAAFAA